jgi:aconitase B
MFLFCNVCLSLTIFKLPFLSTSAAGKLLAKFEGQLPTRLWVAPPTRMDEAQLISEGECSTAMYYSCCCCCCDCEIDC